MGRRKGDQERRGAGSRLGVGVSRVEGLLMERMSFRPPAVCRPGCSHVPFHPLHSPLQLSVDLLSPLPVQVDGEAWAQPPSTITFRKLPDPAVMLQKAGTAVSFARQPSKKEETSQIQLLHTVSSSEILFSEGLSSRRSGAKPPPIPEATSL